MVDRREVLKTFAVMVGYSAIGFPPDQPRPPFMPGEKLGKYPGRGYLPDIIRVTAGFSPIHLALRNPSVIDTVAVERMMAEAEAMAKSRAWEPSSYRSELRDITEHHQDGMVLEVILWRPNHPQCELGVHLWSEKFERCIRCGIFAGQEDIHV